MHSRYPRHPNKLAQDRRLNSAFSIYLRVHYSKLHKFTEVSCLTEITGAVFPQLPNFQGHIPTCLRHSNLTAWKKKKNPPHSVLKPFSTDCVHASLCVCMCIHIFRMRRVSFNLTKRRRRGKKKSDAQDQWLVSNQRILLSPVSKKLPVQSVQAAQ